MSPDACLTAKGNEALTPTIDLEIGIVSTGMLEGIMLVLDVEPIGVIVIVAFGHDISNSG